MDLNNPHGVLTWVTAGVKTGGTVVYESLADLKQPTSTPTVTDVYAVPLRHTNKDKSAVATVATAAKRESVFGSVPAGMGGLLGTRVLTNRVTAFPPDPRVELLQRMQAQHKVRY